MQKNIKIKKMYLGLFILSICMPQFLWLALGSYVDSPNYENRSFADRPVFRMAAYADYPAAYEAYFNDNLPFRSKLISLNSWINYLVFQRSVNDNVLLGSHKWLFYKSTADGNPIGDYDGSKVFSEQEIDSMKYAAVQTQKRLAQMGIQIAVIIPPNKERIYAQYMPAQYELSEISRSDQMIEELKTAKINIVNPKEDLLRLKQEYEIYYPDDTHWNQIGAYIGTCNILKTWNVKTTDLSELTVKSSTRGGGDLAGMLSLGDSIFKEGTEYSIEENDSDGGTQMPDGTIYLKNADAAIQKKLLIIGDSFREAMLMYGKEASNRKQ